MKNTGLLRKEDSVNKFIQAVEVICFLTGEHDPDDARGMVLRLCSKHHTELGKNERFRAVTNADPSLLRDMLGYAARDDGSLMR